MELACVCGGAVELTVIGWLVSCVVAAFCAAKKVFK